MNKYLKYFSSLLFFLITSFYPESFTKRNTTATVKLGFINVVKDKMLHLNDSTYVNPFYESYTVSKLRYYVSNIIFQNDKTEFKEDHSYHLIDEAELESKIIEIRLPPGNYDSMKFLLGVDSLHNVSGAQSGDLDPDKDMFWTWNSGYVMAKMEGNSPSSNLVNNKFEYHIGGFSGTNNVLKEIRLPVTVGKYQFESGKLYTIFIKADVNAWWQSAHGLKIAEHPAVTTPGALAKSISDNYANMFHIEKIIAQ